jgi:hypothetical protein
MVHLTSCSGYKNITTTATREREEIKISIGRLSPFSYKYMCSSFQSMCHISQSGMGWVNGIVW